MVTSQDLAITGDLIASMPESERWFEVVGKPYYETYNPVGNAENEKKKMAIPVKLSNGASGIYYPNSTSSRKITSLMLVKLGNTEMDNWVGHSFVWGMILDQKIAGAMKKVLYITSLK